MTRTRTRKALHDANNLHGYSNAVTPAGEPKPKLRKAATLRIASACELAIFLKRLGLYEPGLIRLIADMGWKDEADAICKLFNVGETLHPMVFMKRYILLFTNGSQRWRMMSDVCALSRAFVLTYTLI